MPENLLTRTQVAAMVGVHPLTIRVWERTKRITPTAYIGRRPRYSLEAVEKAFTKTPVQTKKTPGDE